MMLALMIMMMLITLLRAKHWGQHCRLLGHTGIGPDNRTFKIILIVNNDNFTFKIILIVNYDKITFKIIMIVNNWINQPSKSPQLSKVLIRPSNAS